MRKLRVIVNAIPLVTVNTGIGRYLRCLYGKLEEHYGGEIEIGYFDGRRVSRTAPSGPRDLAGRSRLTNLLWRMPPLAALAVRLARHLQREAAFAKAAKDFDLYHEAAFFPFRAQKNLKTVFTVHDLSLLRFPEHHPNERVRYFRMFFFRRLAQVGRYLAVSEFTRSEMAALLGLDPGHITVTHNAHEPHVFYPRPGPLPTFPGLTLPERFFLFVGTYDPRKNMHVIPAALARSGLSIPLVTAGWTGWSRERLDGPAPIELGYAGDDALAALYSHATALVYPSLYEGFGLPVLEAMACGCPVLTSRLSSLPEVAGDAGLYLDNPSDPDEMGRALARLAGDDILRRDMSAKGLQQARRFSWDETARLTRDVFREAMDG